MRNLSDRFIAAARLCTSSAPIKTRLCDAWLYYLDEIKPAEMPHALRQEFRGLRQAMYRHEPQPEEPAPKASIRKMSASQATRYTAMIVRMLGEILRMKYAAQRDLQSSDGVSVLEQELELELETQQRLN